MLSVSRASSGAAVTVSRPSISYTAPGLDVGEVLSGHALAEDVEAPVARHRRRHPRQVQLPRDVLEAVGVAGLRVGVAQRDHRAAPEVEHRLVALVDRADPQRHEPVAAVVARAVLLEGDDLRPVRSVSPMNTGRSSTSPR